jgi:transcription antitermination factor NusG
MEPHPFLRIGRRVRIRRGALEGAEGFLLRKKERMRFILSVELLMRSVSVEVDAADVEPI